MIEVVTGHYQQRCTVRFRELPQEARVAYQAYIARREKRLGGYWCAREFYWTEKNTRIYWMHPIQKWYRAVIYDIDAKEPERVYHRIYWNGGRWIAS